ncbi:MAG: hypothetical protein IT330_00630 [Anaerolineae bacterium]|nr:hypothetical protein [Anaerolineae bacterium]
MMQDNQFLGILNILRKRLWLILLLFVGTMAVVAATSLRAPVRYRAVPTLQVIAVDPEEVSLFSQQRTIGVTERILAVQGAFMNVLQDPRVAWQTIGDLRLPMDAGQFRERLRVARDGEFVTVVFNGDTPQQAQTAVARHVENARKTYQDVHARPAVVVGQFIQQQASQKEQELNAAKDALLKFKLQHNIVSLDQEVAAYRDLIRGVRQSRDQAVVEAERASSLAAEWTKAADAVAALVPTYRSQAAAFRAQVREAKEKEQESPEAEVSAALAARQADEAEALERGYRTTAINQQALATAQQVAAGQYDQVLAQRESELATLIGLSAEYEILTTAVQRLQTDYDFLRAKAGEAELKARQSQELGFLQVIAPAQAPETPVARATVRIGVVAAVVSLMAGIILAFLLEFLGSLGRTAGSLATTAGRSARR